MPGPPPKYIFYRAFELDVRRESIVFRIVHGWVSLQSIYAGVLKMTELPREGAGRAASISIYRLITAPSWPVTGSSSLAQNRGSKVDLLRDTDSVDGVDITL